MGYDKPKPPKPLAKSNGAREKTLNKMKRDEDSSTGDPDPLNRAQAVFLFNVRAGIERLGITQAEFARRVGKDPSSISNWFAGKSSPPISDLAIVADVLGITLSSLFADPNDERETTVSFKSQQSEEEQIARHVLESLGFRAGRLIRKRRE